jgi:hypothetical protein
MHRRGLERNRTVVTEGEISSVVFPTINKTSSRGHSIGTVRLVLDDIHQKGLEGNRTVVTEVETSRVFIPTIDRIAFCGHSVGTRA